MEQTAYTALKLYEVITEHLENSLSKYSKIFTVHFPAAQSYIDNAKQFVHFPVRNFHLLDQEWPYDNLFWEVYTVASTHL